MKAIQKISDLDKIKKLVAMSLIYNNKKSLVFIDTNILIWIYRLNEDSFNEFRNLLNSLTKKKKLIIPNWVIHEYNNLLSSNSPELFYPFRKKITSLSKDIDYLLEIGRLTSNNKISKENGYIDKNNFISELRQEINSIKKKIKIITNKGNFRTDERREYIESLISSTQSLMEVNDITKFYQEFEFRYSNKIPPGFKDSSKEKNRFGDAIIWREILYNSQKRKARRVLFVSLDVKIDWVYKPEKIKISNKIEFNNKAKKYYLIHPWLEEEFKGVVKKGQIAVTNISSIIDVLYSPDFNQIMFNDFKYLAKTVDIELNGSETNKLIEWIIVNEQQFNIMIKSVCSWEHSPSEINEEELRKWCEINVPKEIDIRQVKWTDIIVNLFI